MKKILLSLVIAGSAFAYTNCTVCHNGGMAKPLSQFTPAEIEAKMKDFKAGNGNSTMVGFAKAMSDTQIKEAAQKYGKK